MSLSKIDIVDKLESWKEISESLKLPLNWLKSQYLQKWTFIVNKKEIATCYTNFEIMVNIDLIHQHFSNIMLKSKLNVAWVFNCTKLWLNTWPWHLKKI